VYYGRVDRPAELEPKTDARIRWVHCASQGFRFSATLIYGRGRICRRKLLAAQRGEVLRFRRNRVAAT
jgi:hypothetical protein